MTILKIACCVFAVALFGSATGEEKDPLPWVGTWAASPQPFMPGNLELYHNQTLRLIVHTSVAGTMVRVKVSNAYGDRPLRIGGAHVARRTAAATIDSTTDRVLRFAGNLSTAVPAGSTAVSDPVSLDLAALSDLAVSIFLPEATKATTSHLLAQQTSYVSPNTGDSTAAVDFPTVKTIDSWPFLTGVDVVATPGASVIVAFGDSSVDGDGTTVDSNHRWPDLLAARLQGGDGHETGVLNEGIVGNRLLLGSPREAKQFGAALGEAGVERFARDALGQARIRCVIVRIGANDIGFPGAITRSDMRVSAEQLMSGYRVLISRARRQGIRVIGTTLSPFEGASIPGYYTAEKERVRQKVNSWIRSGGEFDAVVDLDALLRDPGHPSRLRPDYDSGDHLHTNDIGYAATANAIPLALLGVT